MYKISFIGLGYVGLVSAICFSSKNFKTYCFDIDKSKITHLKNKKIPIYEKNLRKFFLNSFKKNKISFLENINDVVKNSDIIFITVGTPSNKDGSINLSYVINASKDLAIALKNIKNYKLVVIKSTVIPGTTENIVKPIIEKTSNLKLGKDFGLCVNPEFLREGNAVFDTFNPDRIIIGEFNSKDGDILENFYKEFYGKKLPPILRTNPINAELIKYANNCFLAMKVSYINMIANLCQKLKGADVEIIAKGIGFDKRIGNLFLKAGAGWGGSCFPKDLSALNNLANSLNLNLPLVDSTIKINEEQPYKLIELAKEELKDLKGKTISILGLSFKPNTDDIRNAVSIKVINKLLKEKSEIKVYDPKAIKNIKKIFKNKIIYSKNVYDCLNNSDCAIIVTEWEIFKRLKPEDFISRMKNPLIIDGRRIYNPELFVKKIKYKAIGYNSY